MFVDSHFSDLGLTNDNLVSRGILPSIELVDADADRNLPVVREPVPNLTMADSQISFSEYTCAVNLANEMGVQLDIELESTFE